MSCRVSCIAGGFGLASVIKSENLFGGICAVRKDCMMLSRVQCNGQQISV